MIPVISGIIKLITSKSRFFIYRFDRFPTTVKPYFFVENQEDLHTKWMLTTAVRLDDLQTEKKRENCQSRCNERNWFKLQSYQVASPRLQSLYLNYFSNIIHTKKSQFIVTNCFVAVALSYELSCVVCKSNFLVVNIITSALSKKK